jgi:molybdopterin converting factor small subunit
MIRVKCMGHIASAVGAEEISLAEGGIEASDVVEKVRALTALKDPGFTKYNTLVVVEDGDAFVPAGRTMRIPEGASVALVPFSHGG